jgi:phosphoribosylanthranilate isomerase
MIATATLLKVCGLTRRVDAGAAARAGATFGGVILAPGTPRTVTTAAARVIFGDGRLRTVGVFVNAAVDEVRRAVDGIGLAVVQLHGDEPPETAFLLRDGGVAVWKAVRVRSSADVRTAIDRYDGAVDALLLDGWSARARGGTGTAFGWTEVAPAAHGRPRGMGLVVAGGLTALVVADAIRILRPDVVDVSSGAESSPGRKDVAAIDAFASAVGACAGS